MLQEGVCGILILQNLPSSRYCLFLEMFHKVLKNYTEGVIIKKIVHRTIVNFIKTSTLKLVIMRPIKEEYFVFNFQFTFVFIIRILTIKINWCFSAILLKASLYYREWHCIFHHK